MSEKLKTIMSEKLKPISTNETLPLSDPEVFLQDTQVKTLEGDKSLQVCDHESLVSDAKSEVLAMFKDEEKLKPVENMTKDEIGNEYINLLRELSSNFDNSKEGKYGKGISSNSAGDETLVKKYTGEKGDINAEPSNLLKLADLIIEADTVWDDASEKNKDLQAEISEIKEDAKRMNFIKKTMTARSRNKKIKSLEMNIGYNMYQKTKGANSKLENSLEEAYSPDSYYDHRRNKNAVAADNDKFNQKFFSTDRMDKINRAKELRRQFDLVS